MQKYIVCISVLFIIGCAGKASLTLAEQEMGAVTLGETLFEKDGLIVDLEGHPANGKVKTSQQTAKLSIRGEPVTSELVMINELEERLAGYKYFAGLNAFYQKGNNVFVDSEGNAINDSVVMLSKMFDRTDIFTVTNGVINGSYQIFIGDMLYEDIPYVNGKKEGVADRYLRAERQRPPSNSRSSLSINYSYDQTKRTYANDMLVSEKFLEGRELLSEKIYENGMLIQSIDYNNGKMVRLSNYKDNIKNGEEIRYDENGIQTSVTIYVDGKREGNVKTYSSSGSLRLEENYVNDKRDGAEKYYYENGTISSETSYSNGERIAPIIGYYEDGRKRFFINIGPDLKDGYCFDQNGNRARDFAKTERYNIWGLQQFACPEYAPAE